MLILDYPLISDLSMAGPLMFFLFLFLDKEINLEVQYVSITDQGTCGNKIKKFSWTIFRKSPFSWLNFDEFEK